jgi:chromosome segregation ATPase
MTASNNSTPAPPAIMQSIQQLMEDRKKFEHFVQESQARLNELRDQVRAEKVAADTELEKLRQVSGQQDNAELEPLRLELREAQLASEAARTRVQEVERDLGQLRIDRDTIANELDQLKQQVERQATQSGEFDELLQALVMEVGQREEVAFAQRTQFEEETTRLRNELKETQEREQSVNEQLSKAREVANKAAQSQQDGQELADTAALIEQVEAEIRQQQEAVRKEREAVAKERADVEAWRNQLEEWRRSMSQQAGDEVPEDPHRNGPRILKFACKHCNGAVQAKEWLAGLVTKCPQCGKMAPVPKLGS